MSRDYSWVTLEDIKAVYPEYTEPDLTSWAEWLLEGLRDEVPDLVEITLGQTCRRLNEYKRRKKDG